MRLTVPQLNSYPNMNEKRPLDCSRATLFTSVEKKTMSGNFHPFQRGSLCSELSSQEGQFQNDKTVE